MPHFRRIWTKFTYSQDVQAMPDDTTRLAWALLPTALDREGRGIYNGKWLTSQLFPLREDLENAQGRAMLDWWAARGMIVRYSVRGVDYFLIPPDAWAYYQGDTSREAVSEIPPPPPELLMSYSRPDLVPLKSRFGTAAAAEAEAKQEAEAEAKQEAEAAAPDVRAVLLPAANIAALAAANVGEPERSELSRLPFVNPEYVEAWRAEVGRRADTENPTGLLVHCLRSGQWPDPPRKKRKGGNGNDAYICGTCHQHPCTCDDWKRFQ
jgi:hypothetical protein